MLKPVTTANIRKIPLYLKFALFSPISHSDYSFQFASIFSLSQFFFFIMPKTKRKEEKLCPVKRNSRRTKKRKVQLEKDAGPFYNFVRGERPLQITKIIEPIVVFMNIRLILILILDIVVSLHTSP